MKLLNVTALIFAISLITIGCIKDDFVEEEIIEPYNFSEDCELIADIGKVEIEPDSKHFIPYPYGMEKIIFKDSTDKEYVGNVIEYNEEYPQNNLLSIRPCPSDDEILIQYYYQPEFKRLRLNFDDLGIWMSVSISPSISNGSYENLEVADICNVFLGLVDEGGPANSLMSIAVNKRTDPMPYETYSDFHDTYEINDEVYNNVYINNIEGKEDYEILYNDEFGILRIRSMMNTKLDLVLDRIE